MLFSISFARERRAALGTLICGVLLALSPLAALATGTVTLAWDPSSGTNVIANYNVYYGGASAAYTNVVAAGTNTTVSISNLVEGATYYFAAAAVDTYGLESDYSTEVSTLIPIKLDEPAAHAERVGERYHQRGRRFAGCQPLRHHLRRD